MYGIPAAAGLSAHQRYISPWVGATADKKGEWTLPTYPCELRGLKAGDPRAEPWKPGEFKPGVDNVSTDQDTKEVLTWGGQKMWEGELPPQDWKVEQYSEAQQRLLQVPHMPGQPLKEIFARQKAVDPRPFEDRFFDQIHRTLPENWRALAKHAAWFEAPGVNKGEEEPAESQACELIPVLHTTDRPDVVIITVGVSDVDPKTLRVNNEDAQAYVEDVEPPLEDQVASEAPFDFLQLLYARDHEGKVIQIRRFRSKGLVQRRFVSFAFVPPTGTKSITPFACFNTRGVWRGKTISWDPAVENQDMAWFSDMDPQMRFELADWEKLDAASREQVRRRPVPKSSKEVPVLWPENSWQGNAAKARAWRLPHT